MIRRTLSRLATAAVGMAVVVVSAHAGEIPLDQRRSGYAQMSSETQAMQDEETANPGMLWVLDGEALWTAKDSGVDRSCADCHGEATLSMKGVAARHPAYDGKRGKAVDLAGRINICRVEYQSAPALDPESRNLLALAAFVARQSRGIAIASDEKNLKPLIEEGRAIFTRRQGHLDLSCAHCHTANQGRKLAGIPLSQGHPTGYPLYRLEWQTFGSLQRRLRNCLTGMRAEPYPYNAPEHLALEAYLMWRARGMTLESPAIRP